MNWQELENACEDCRRCALGRTRTHPVVGSGCREAKIMLIGEGPGEQEDLSGEAFVGPAGRLLDEMLNIIDLDRKKNCYIANIVKCRPPKNRDPKDEEQDACMGFLEAQLGLIQPELIVCLGRIAACRLIRPDYRITREHGTWAQFRGIPITAMYHPSALLRTPEKRPEAFEDLLKIREKARELSLL